MERDFHEANDGVIDLGVATAETKGPPLPESADFLGNLGGAGLSDD